MITKAQPLRKLAKPSVCDGYYSGRRRKTILPLLCYNKKHEFIYWHIKVPTQLPFELKLRMPSTDHGGRGYSDEYIATIETSLYI